MQSVPPPETLWESYREKTAEGFLRTGEKDTDKMLEVLATGGFELGPSSRVLDFGCAAGRMIRWVNERCRCAELWGVDIDKDHIQWCNRHLPPHLKFLHIPNAPHLPFEDGYFDLVYAGSVFSHIEDHVDFWLRELLRILKKGGRLYVTVNDRSSIKTLLGDPRWKAHFLKSMIGVFQGDDQILDKNFERFGFPGDPKTTHVFYDTNYLKKHWGRFAKVLSATPNAYAFQTAFVLAK